MAKPLTADQQMAAYKAAGVTIREVSGWRQRGMWRIPAKGWEPHGVVIHHTAGDLGGRSVSQYIDDIINGDPACPDKANVVIDPDGVLWVNAAGRANHCLQYSDKAWSGWLNESFPFTGSVNWRGSNQNANKYTYGGECIAAGAPNAAQQETAARWAAAICRAHGWSAGSVCGHGEVADDRDWSDPGLDMGAFRKRVAAILGGKSSGGATAAAAPSKPAESSTPANTSNASNSSNDSAIENGDLMMRGCYYHTNSRTTIYLLFNEQSGFYHEFSKGDNAGPLSAGYVNPIAQNWNTGAWPEITAGHAGVLKSALDDVRKGR